MRWCPAPQGCPCLPLLLSHSWAKPAKGCSARHKLIKHHFVPIRDIIIIICILQMEEAVHRSYLSNVI